MTFPVTPVFEQSDTLVLAGGLLVYSDGRRARLVTQHEAIVERDKAPRLGPARLVRREAVLALLRGLELAPQSRFVLPPRVLCWESSVVCWWRPAGRRRIYFHAQNDALNALSDGEVMHPPLLFRARTGHLSVWALGRDERPTAETRVCRAPYFNVYDTGAMCAGSVQYPEQPRPDNLDAWEECFFGSLFTHGNTQRLLKEPMTHTRYWTALAKPNATKAFAMRHLRVTPLTLGDIVTGGDAGGEGDD